MCIDRRSTVTFTAGDSTAGIKLVYYLTQMVIYGWHGWHAFTMRSIG
jgi:hypothetical protein